MIRSEAEVIAAFGHLAAAVDNDLAQTSDQITFNSHSAFDVQLDRTPLEAYLRRNLHAGWLYNVLEAAYVNEFGLDMQDQSSLNFLLTIGTDTSNGFEIYGTSDQRYKVQGGNHQIVAALADQVADRLSLGYQLEALGQRSNGEYVLTFATGGGRSEVTADIVVLCIPFTILREVDLRVSLPAIKWKAIRQLGYGVDAKLILGFTGRPWRGLEYDGDSYADLPFQSGWDGSRGQPDVVRSLHDLPRRKKDCRLLGNGTAPGRRAQRLFPGLEQVFPGVQRQWLGTALRAYWPSNPFIKSELTPPIVPANGPASAAPSRCRWGGCTSRANTPAWTGRVT